MNKKLFLLITVSVFLCGLIVSTALADEQSMLFAKFMPPEESRIDWRAIMQSPPSEEKELAPLTVEDEKPYLTAIFPRITFDTKFKKQSPEYQKEMRNRLILHITLIVFTIISAIKGGLAIHKGQKRRSVIFLALSCISVLIMSQMNDISPYLSLAGILIVISSAIIGTIVTATFFMVTSSIALLTYVSVQFTIATAGCVGASTAVYQQLSFACFIIFSLVMIYIRKKEPLQTIDNCNTP